MADPYGDLSDLQILEADPAPPPDMMSSSSEAESSPADIDQSSLDTAESSPAYEDSPSPDETQASPESQETAESPRQEKHVEQDPEEEDFDTWAAPLLRNPEIGPLIKAVRDNLKVYKDTFGSVANARYIKQLGGVEGIKALKAKHDEVTRVDEIVFGSDIEAKREYFAQVRQQNPQAFLSAVFTGLDALKQSDPQYFEYLTVPYVAEALNKEFVWEWLEHLNKDAERRGDHQMIEGLNRIAEKFHTKYGLGPNLPEAPEAAERRATFHAEVGRVAGVELDDGIARYLNEQLPNLDPKIKESIFDQAHVALQNIVRNDTHLRFALQNSFRRAPSKKLGNSMAQLLVSNLWPHIPRIVQLLAKDHLPAKQASAPAKQKASSSARKLERRIPKPDLSKMTGREMLDLPEDAVAAARAVPQGVVMTREQVKRSRDPFHKILEDGLTVVDG